MTISLERFGSFFIGGRRLSIKNRPLQRVFRNRDFPSLELDVNGEYVIDQAYVQFFEPVHAHPNPIVLIHGGGHAGTIWEHTPDGRTGWLHLFLSEERTVYVVDNVERGRAGWCCIPGIWEGEPELRSSRNAWDHFRLGSIDADGQQKPFTPSQFPTEAFEELLRYNVPRWNTHTEVSTEALRLLSERVGPAWLVVHSQAGEYGMGCAFQAREHLKGLILLEPGSFPVAEHYRDLSGLPVLMLWGDHVEKTALWRDMLPFAHEAKSRLEQNGASVEWIELPTRGIYGNSHVMMMDRNSDEVALFVLDWIHSQD